MGYGPLVRCVSGLTSLWRYPDDEGGFSDSTTIHPDHYAARVTAITALAALIGRRRSGRGAEIATSQAEAILMQIGDLLVEESLAPGAVRATGNAGRHGAPWGVYPCAGDDEWCVVTVRDDEDWARLRSALGDPDWAKGQDLATTTAAGRRITSGVPYPGRTTATMVPGGASASIAPTASCLAGSNRSPTSS